MLSPAQVDQFKAQGFLKSSKVLTTRRSMSFGPSSSA